MRLTGIFRAATNRFPSAGNRSARPPLAFGSRDRIVVVGAGAAGLAAAEELRRLGYEGRLVVLSDEEQPPYDRPACSKGLLTGRQKPSDTHLKVPPKVQLRLGVRAVGLDPAGHTVTLDDGRTLGYDGVVLATGSRPVPPKGWPVGEPGLYPLHSLGNGWAVRQALLGARRVAVVGGGLTGCEVACAVQELGRHPVVIDSRRHLMQRAIGEPVGAMVTERYRQHGLELRLGRRVRGLERWRHGWRLVLDDGSAVLADLVVAAIGERPETEWLAGTGLDLGDGVRCDEALRVVGAEHAVAAGVLVRWPNLRFSPEPVRVGHWIPALEQGRAAARTLLAGSEQVPAATLVPRFWSYQDNLRIQVAGVLDPRAEVTMAEVRPGRSDPARSGILAGYRRNGRLVGLVAVNAPQAFAVAARVMLAEGGDAGRPANGSSRGGAAGQRLALPATPLDTATRVETGVPLAMATSPHASDPLLTPGAPAVAETPILPGPLTVPAPPTGRRAAR